MTDTLLDVALANWAARFCANGVDPSDLERLAASLSSWDQWCEVWSDQAERYRSLGHDALTRGRRRSAGEHLARAATYFHFAQFLFDDRPEEAEGAHRRAVDCLDEALPLLDPPGWRIAIPFEGSTLAGVVRRPAGADPAPLVILIAGLDSTKEEFRLVETAFLERGVATLALDGPGQGEGSAWAARPDWEILAEPLTEAARHLEGVDASRVALWGVSLGGYYVVRLASAMTVRAVVSLSGPFDLGAHFPHLNPLTRGAFQARSRAGSADGALERARAFTLERHAPLVLAPLLAIAGTNDRLFPAEDATRLVEAVGGPAELLVIPGGNHGCANSVNLHRTLAADWVAEHLGAH